MPEFQEKRNVIILCDSWYVKSTMTALVDEYENLDLIGNARIDTAIYDLPPVPTGKRSRPPKRGSRLFYGGFPALCRKDGWLLYRCTHGFDKYLFILINMVKCDRISLVFIVGYLYVFCDFVEHMLCFELKSNKFKPRRSPNMGIIYCFMKNIFINREMRCYFGLRKLQ